MRDLLTEFGITNVEQNHDKVYKLPAVIIGRRCDCCGNIFALSHPKSEEKLCDKCRRIHGNN